MRAGRWTAIGGIAILAIVAAAIRVAPLHGEVFAPDGVILQGNDPWYHLRLATHLAAEWPSVMGNDALALHPGGQDVLVAPGLDALAAGIAALVAGGRPTPTGVASVAAWLPPVLAGLVVFAAGILGLRHGGPAAGVLAAALLAAAPGPFLDYSILGYFDHHILEALLACAVILALGNSNQHRASWTSVLVAGLFLAAYLLTWVGGGFLVGVLAAWAVCIAVAWPGLRAVLLVRVLTSLVAAGLVLCGFRGLGGWVDTHLAVLAATVGGIAVILAGSALTRWTARPALVWAGMVIFTTAILAVAGRGRIAGLGQFVQMVGWLARGSREALVQEATPLFSSAAGPWWRPAWDIFGLTGLVGLAGIGLTLRRARATFDPGLLLVGLFGLIALLATMAQQRFAYYAAVPMAVFSALAIAGLARWMVGRQGSTALWWVAGWGSATLVTLACLAPAVQQAHAILTRPSGPPPDWREGLRWLRDHSPSPSTSPYGVMCTWDRGYWVTAFAERAPNANPTQANAAPSSAYFLSGSETEALATAGQLESRYVVLDCTVPVWPGSTGNMSVGKLPNLAGWAQRDPREYFEYARASAEPAAPRLLLFHPAYYQTMAVRLFVFGGEAYLPTGDVLVVQLASPAPETIGAERYLRASRSFPDYAAADAFLAAHPGDGWQLVGLSPAESCVPLEALRRHRLVHQSPTTVAERGARRLGYVQIFEIVDE